MFPKTLQAYKQFRFLEQDEFGTETEKLVEIYLHKDYDIGMHSHDFYEINIVLRGKGCHYIGDAAIPISGGDVFVVPPDVAHGYYCSEKTDVYHILLRKAFVEKYRADLEKVPGFATLFEIEPYLRQVYDSSLFLQLDKIQLSRFHARLDEMIACKGAGGYMHTTLLTAAFISELCCGMAQWRMGEKQALEDRDILAVLEYMQMHYSEKVTVEDLMTCAHMSRPTLHRRFKAVTKRTPMEYLMRLRVQAARAALESNAENKTRVAQNAGFYDASHMYKYLKLF